MKNKYIGSGLLILVLLGCFVFVCGCDGEPYTEIQWNEYSSYTTSSQPFIRSTLIFHEGSPNTFEWVFYERGRDIQTGATSGTITRLNGEWEPVTDSNHLVVNLPDVAYPHSWGLSDPHHADFFYDSYYPRIGLNDKGYTKGYLYQDVETYKKYTPPSYSPPTLPGPTGTEIIVTG